MNMRCVAAVLTLLVSLVPALASAQERQFGAKLGPTFSSGKIEPDDLDDGYDTRIGVTIGGFLVLPANRFVALQLEGLLNPKGGKADFGEGVTDTVTFTYLEFPVLGRLTATRSASRSFYVFGGPAIGIRVRAERELASAGGGFNSGYADDISRDVERFEFSAVAGAGVDIGRHLVIDARYSWGLSDVNKDTSEGTLRNRAFTVLAGYRF